MSETIRGREALSPRVKSVVPLPDWQLRLAFNNGETRIFDAKPLLQYPAFHALRDEAFFRRVHVGFGTICWLNDIDYCPDTLYQQSKASE